MRQLYLPLFMIALALVAVGCENPADGKTEAVVQEPVTEPAPAAAADGVSYALAEGSSISWVGSKVTGKHDGGFESFEGEIVLVDGDPAASSVSIMIDATSIWSDHDGLTGHLKNADFFDVETYPTASFVSTSITPAEGGFEVTGNLEMRGVTKSITFPATIEIVEDSVSAQAEFFIQRFDWGIEYAGKADDLIRDEVVIKFDLKAVPAA